MTSISHDCCASILPATILIISFSKQRQFLISNNDGEFLLVFNDDVVCPLTMIFSSMFVASLLVVALFVILTQESIFVRCSPFPQDTCTLSVIEESVNSPSSTWVSLRVIRLPARSLLLVDT
ncbi:hypothetical protein Csa_018259 [Cucumis sativus]|uniref:Uncharacterized protein n=1 Tax=Cucumis sativus TaxID=3659 RepID=A0A0A0KDC5_CUCSA|nr:hypothetical protein Csa_018259 [Cucumis sativus]